MPISSIFNTHLHQFSPSASLNSAIDGTVKLSVNGKFVNGLRNSGKKRGYLCLESEGAEIHFENMRILELPTGVISEEEIAPILN